MGVGNSACTRKPFATAGRLSSLSMMKRDTSIGKLLYRDPAVRNRVFTREIKPGKRCLGALSCSIAILLSGLDSHALTVTWNGSKDNTWGMWKNWSGDGNNGAQSGDSLVFDGTANLSNQNDLSSSTFNGITFAATAGAFILGDHTSNLITLTGAVVNQSSNTQTLNLPLALTSGTLIEFSATNGAIADSAVISGGGGLRKTGTRTLTLSATNTYSGATEIDAGVLSVSLLASGGTASGIGASGSAASNLVLAGGTLQYTDGNVTVNRGFTLNNGTTNGIEVTNSAAVLTMSGAVPATTGGLNKTGPGSLVLSGTALFTGPTAILSGTLRILAAGSLNGSSKITVSSGATFDFDSIAGGFTVGSGKTLAGSGLVTGSSTLSVSGGGDIAASGTLTLQTGLTLASTGGSQFDLHLGANSDLVRLTGANTFTPNTSGSTVFNLVGTTGFTKGSTYTLVNWTGGTGPTSLFSNEFVLSAASQAVGMSGSFSLSGSLLQFTVNNIPESNSAAFLPWGTGIILLWNRRRRTWRTQ